MHNYMYIYIHIQIRVVCPCACLLKSSAAKSGRPIILLTTLISTHDCDDIRTLSGLVILWNRPRDFGLWVPQPTRHRIHPTSHLPENGGHTACGRSTWGVRPTCHKPISRFFHHGVWWSVEITSLYIRACVLLNIVLNLTECDQGFILITMFCITSNDVE